METCEKMSFRRATEADVDAVAALYRAAVGGEGCVWNEFYPTEEDARTDARAGCLFIGEINGNTVAAASFVPERELDDLPVFQIRENVREIARVTVAPAYRGHGYAKALLADMMKREAGAAFHLLVAKCNPAAQKTYRALGFVFLGECRMYDNDYYICERLPENVG